MSYPTCSIILYKRTRTRWTSTCYRIKIQLVLCASL